jgi:hypothetical protein
MNRPDDFGAVLFYTGQNKLTVVKNVLHERHDLVFEW